MPRRTLLAGPTFLEMEVFEASWYCWAIALYWRMHWLVMFSTHLGLWQGKNYAIPLLENFLGLVACQQILSRNLCLLQKSNGIPAEGNAKPETDPFPLVYRIYSNRIYDFERCNLKKGALCQHVYIVGSHPIYACKTWQISVIFWLHLEKAFDNVDWGFPEKYCAALVRISDWLESCSLKKNLCSLWSARPKTKFSRILR
jgi:hypothetical protein